MTEDHGLGDGDGSVDITESVELLLPITAQDIVLLDGVQRLLLSLQLDDVGVGNNFLDSNLLGVYELQLGAPVQDSAGGSLVLTFIASNSICQLKLWIEFPHLLDHFACLKCQLVCWRKVTLCLDGVPIPITG
uniref:Uncharacterized protein n=1 Tax=Sphenodon punctatus TaxID=8508 RepID=A0A8D0L238_SPHPU